MSLAAGKGNQKLLLSQLQALKRRRQGRINQGVPVMGYRVRNRRLRRGKPLPMSRTGIQQMSGQIPSAVVTAQEKLPAEDLPIRRSEWSFDVLAPGTTTAAPEPIALYPTNTQMFTSLNDLASQYQYFKWGRLCFSYTNCVTTTTSGQLGIGFAADSNTAAGITEFSRINSLPRNSIGVVYNPLGFSVGPSDFNKQFAMQGCAIEAWASTPETDPQYVPGYLVLGIDGCTAAKNTKLGTMTVEYYIELKKEKVDPEPKQSGLTCHCAVPTTANLWEALMTKYGNQTWLQPDVILSQTSAQVLRVLANIKRTFNISFLVHGSSSAPGFTYASTDGTHVVTTTTSGYSTIITIAFRPNIRGGYIEITRPVMNFDAAIFSVHRVRNVADSWATL